MLLLACAGRWQGVVQSTPLHYSPDAAAFQEMLFILCTFHVRTRVSPLRTSRFVKYVRQTPAALCKRWFQNGQWILKHPKRQICTLRDIAQFGEKKILWLHISKTKYSRLRLPLEIAHFVICHLSLNIDWQGIIFKFVCHVFFLILK